jgi:iron complex outermembrane recepter protein
MKKKLFALLTALILSSVTIAQQAIPDTTTYNFPFDIIVSATKILTPLKNLPFAASIISRDIMKASLTKTICSDEAFKLAPGIKVDNQADGNRVHLSIRGQGILSERGIRGIKFLLDGIPLNDPSGFAPDLFDVDWATIKNIEILRGPSASIFGGSSSGGIVNITTMDGTSDALGGRVEQIYGTYNSWKTLGEFGGTAKDINYRVSLSRAMGDGYRVHTHYSIDNFYGKFNYTPSTLIKIIPVIYFTKSFNENPEGLNLYQVFQDPSQPNADAVPKNEFISTERFTTGASASIVLDESNTILVNGFVRRTAYKESVPSSIISRTYVTPGTSAQYIMTVHANDVTHVISIGTDVEYQSINEVKHSNLGGGIEDFSTIQSDQDISQRGLGVFATYRLDFLKNWSATFSSRYDNIHYDLTDNFKQPRSLSGTKDYNKATFRFGVTYTPITSLNLFTNFGQGFTPPSVEELANNPDPLIFGGFNKYLTYASSNGAEIGARGDLIYRKIYYELSAFYLKTNNDFDRFRIPGRPSETFYRNTDSLGNALSSNRFGVELYLRINPLDKILIQAAYTYSNFRYSVNAPERIIMDDEKVVKYIMNGNILPNSPEHQLYMDFQYNLMPELYLGVSTEIYSRSFIDGANIVGESVPGFALYNARLGYKFNFCSTEYETSISAKNLFSRKWIAFTEPDPGGNSYQPGTPFEIFGTVSIKL